MVLAPASPGFLQRKREEYEERQRQNEQRRRAREAAREQEEERRREEERLKERQRQAAYEEAQRKEASRIAEVGAAAGRAGAGRAACPLPMLFLHSPAFGTGWTTQHSSLLSSRP